MTKKINAIVGKVVTVRYTTINLGNGSKEEQESDTITGKFTGEYDTNGRTLRYAFVREMDNTTFYLFVDEIRSIKKGR